MKHTKSFRGNQVSRGLWETDGKFFSVIVSRIKKYQPAMKRYACMEECGDHAGSQPV